MDGGEQGVTVKHQCGDLTIDFEMKNLLRGQEKVHLQPKEYDVLRYFFLCLAEGKIVTKPALYQHLYYEMKPLDQDDLKLLDVFLCKVRKKLQGAESNCQIVTLGHKGYKLALKPNSSK